jgi:DNA-binding NtrC family response regulator
MLPRSGTLNAGPSSAEEQAAVIDLFQGDEFANGHNEDAFAAADCVSIDAADEEAVSAEWFAELPSTAAEPTLANATVDLKQMLADFESAWIREAMKVTEGNITHAAELLGLARTTLIERLRKYDLSASRH